MRIDLEWLYFIFILFLLFCVVQVCGCLCVCRCGAVVLRTRRHLLLYLCTPYVHSLMVNFFVRSLCVPVPVSAVVVNQPKKKKKLVIFYTTVSVRFFAFFLLSVKNEEGPTPFYVNRVSEWTTTLRILQQHAALSSVHNQSEFILVDFVGWRRN